MESVKDLFRDLVKWWRMMPEKALFVLLITAWFALFHFWGNSTFGYHKSASLFSWMYFVFTTSPDDDLCLYVPLVVLALLVWKRGELMSTAKRGWWPGVVLVALALALHLMGFVVQQARISILALVLGVYGLTGTVWGPAWLRNTFFPMFLLLFCIPIASVSDGLTLPLRLLATKIAVGISSTVLGISVVSNGAQIIGPGGVPLYEVAPACSGIRSLVSLTLLMLVYAFIVFRSTWRRLVLVGAAVPVAIAGNVLRLVTVIAVGELFGQSAGIAVEQKLGFLTFGLGLLCMHLVAHWLREVEPGSLTPVPRGQEAA